MLSEKSDISLVHAFFYGIPADFASSKKRAFHVFLELAN